MGYTHYWEHPDYDPALHAGHEAFMRGGLCSHPSHAPASEPDPDRAFLRNERTVFASIARACEKRTPESAVAHILRMARASIEDIDDVLAKPRSRPSAPASGEPHRLLMPPHPGDVYQSSALCSCGGWQYDEASPSALVAAYRDILAQHTKHAAPASGEALDYEADWYRKGWEAGAASGEAAAPDPMCGIHTFVRVSVCGCTGLADETPRGETPKRPTGPVHPFELDSMPDEE